MLCCYLKFLITFLYLMLISSFLPCESVCFILISNFIYFRACQTTSRAWSSDGAARWRRCAGHQEALKGNHRWVGGISSDQVATCCRSIWIIQQAREHNQAAGSILFDLVHQLILTDLVLLEIFYRPFNFRFVNILI